MRDKNISFIHFCNNVEDYVVRRLPKIKVLREPVIASPTFLSKNYTLKYSTNKLLDLRGLAVISYYLPAYFCWNIRLDLEGKVCKLERKNQLKLAALLSSQEHMLTYLWETKEFSSHEIFGNLIERGLTTLQQVRIVRENVLVVKSQRKRGYNDKGSIRDKCRWLPTFDWSFTELQNELERRLDFNIRLQARLDQYLLEVYQKLSGGLKD